MDAFGDLRVWARKLGDVFDISIDCPAARPQVFWRGAWRF